MKVIQVWLRVFTLFMVFLFSTVSLQAEGSWQMGLDPSVGHNQPLLDYYSRAQSNDAGLKREKRPLYVDISKAGEVINVHACGNSDGDNIKVEIYSNGSWVASSRTFNSSNRYDGYISCSDPFSGHLNNPFQYTTTAPGTYEIRIHNNTHHHKSIEDRLKRFDVTVTPDSTTPVDPTNPGGRLWSYRYGFNAGSFNDDHSTSANLYAVVDGGFHNSYYVWELNLDHFAGYLYELTANDLGLTNLPGRTPVAGLSGCIDANDHYPCENLNQPQNIVEEKYKLYLSKPTTSYPRPQHQPEITNLKFLDDAGIDDSISPSDTPGVQDTGNFTFDTNIATAATYTIKLDINGDGNYDGHDVYLSGPANPGNNSVNWDGKANDGSNIPSGDYNVKVELKIGEFHFTAADVETSGGNEGPGLTIKAVYDNGVVNTSNKVCWNDKTYLKLTASTADNTSCTERNHNWGLFSKNSDGNKAYIDTYTIGAASAEVPVRLAIEPGNDPRKMIEGDVFEDLNSNGVRDSGELGFPNITVALTEQGSGKTFYVSTDTKGFYHAYTSASESSIKVDVDESMLPPEYIQTAGTDPQIVPIPTDAPAVNNVGSDGYAHGVPVLDINKTADSTRNLVAGQTVTYTYEVTNTGNVDIDNVNITDVHSGTGTLSTITPASVATLAPGSQATFTATYVMTQADVDAGTAVTNEATANGTPKIGILHPPKDDLHITPISGIPAMSIVKTANKTSGLTAGETVTYTYVVTNTGNVDIDSVTVSDVHSGTGIPPVPGSEVLTNTSGHSSDVTVNDGVVDTLAPHDIVTFKGTYVVTQADVNAGAAITNTATANGIPRIGILHPPQDNATVTPVSGIPVMTLDKTADKTQLIPVGETVTYTYVVTNRGNVAINDVKVTDVHSGTGTLSAITPANVATLAPGSQITFTATYVMTQADINAGVAVSNTATANGTPVIGTLTPPTAMESVTPAAPEPLLTLDKTADKTQLIPVGDTVTYTYVVENTGNVDITNVNVTDVHSGTGTLSTITPANVATLAPGDVATFTATYVMTQADVDAGVAVTNTATANGTPVIGVLTPPKDKEIVHPEKAAPLLDINKTADKISNVAAGDTVTYTYVVTNTGNVDIDNVNVTDIHSGTGTLSAITPASVDLAPGDSQIFTSTYVVTQADIDANKTIINTATAHGTPKIGKLKDPTDQATVAPTPGAPAMSIEKSANKKSGFKAGDTVIYTYVVTNTGNVDIDNVTVADVHSGTGTTPIPGSEVLTNTSGLSSDATANDGNIDTLAPGDVATFAGTYVMTQADIDAGAAIENTATVHGTPKTGVLIPPEAKEIVYPATGVPAMTIEKSANKKSGFIAGDTVIYTYVVTNTGNVDIDNVTVADVHIGKGTAPVPGDENLTNTSGLSSDAIDNNGSIDTLAPGDVATFTGTYVVTQADIDAGAAIENTATANGTPKIGTLTPPTAQEIITPAKGVPVLSIEKSANKKSGFKAGDTVIYTYVVTNTGNVDIDNVTVADVHSGTGTTPIPGSEVLTNTSGLSSDATANDGNIDTLAPGDVATFRASYIITQNDIDAGVAILNTATANGTPPPGLIPLVPPTDQEIITPAAGIPVLSIEKSANKKSGFKAGDTVIYTYVVTNVGNVDIDDVTVDDVHNGLGVGHPIPGNEILTNTSGLSSDATVDGSIDTLAPGDVATFTGSYVVDQLDIDAGAPITNIATADGTPRVGILVPPTDQEIVTPASGVPAMTIEKSANKKGNFKAGNRIIYTYVVTNVGNVDIDSVTVADIHSGTGTAPVPGSEVLTNTSGRSSDTVANDGKINIFAPGDVATFAGTYVVTQDDIDAGVAITNTATANGTPRTGTLIPPKDKEIVTPEPPKPGIALVKTASVDGAGAVGDTVTYAFAVTNTGNVVLNDINVSDLLPGLVLSGKPIASLDAGVTDSTSITGTYTITHADAVNGSIINQATVTGVTITGILVKDRSDHNSKTKDRPTETPVLPPVVPPVAIPAELGDLVWYDNNHDGIQNPNENGVGGVKVYLLDGNGVRIQHNGTDIFTETNSTGEYFFDMLTPNKYYAVEFDISTLPVRYEITDQDLGIDESKDSDADSSTGQTDPVLLGNGQVYHDMDMGIKLTIAHIGNYFWIDHNQNAIQDPNENPVVGAKVELLDENGNAVFDENGNDSVTTDVNGHYGFDVLPGLYQIRFNIPATGYEGYIFSAKHQGTDKHIDTDADEHGFTDTITVNAGDNNLTIDAGVNCGCENAPIKANGGDALGLLGMLGMMLMTLITGLFFVRKEEEQRV